MTGGQEVETKGGCSTGGEKTAYQRHIGPHHAVPVVSDSSM